MFRVPRTKAKTFSNVLRNYRNLRKIVNPISVTLGYYTNKADNSAEQMDGVLAKYASMREGGKNNPNAKLGQGMLVISTTWYVASGVPGCSGGGAIKSYYDAATHQFIGDVKE